MPKYDIKVTGSSKLKKRVQELPDDMRAGLKEAVRASAKAFRSDARKRAPEISGDLKRSIRFRVDADGLGATIRVHKHYGVFVEFGTTSQRAQPFMRPAAEAERRQFPRRISGDVRKALGM